MSEFLHFKEKTRVLKLIFTYILYFLREHFNSYEYLVAAHMVNYSPVLLHFLKARDYKKAAPCMHIFMEHEQNFITGLSRIAFL